MILHLLRMRRNVNRNVFNARKKCKRDTVCKSAHVRRILCLISAMDVFLFFLFADLTKLNSLKIIVIFEGKRIAMEIYEIDRRTLFAVE